MTVERAEGTVVVGTAEVGTAAGEREGATVGARAAAKEAGKAVVRVAERAVAG